MSLLSRRLTLAHTLIFYSLLGMVVVLALINPVLSVAGSTPPIGENAYCGKNDVPNFGEKDGPAQLPTSCYYTGMDGTQSPGKQIRVGANSDLRAAVESASCGDTLLLAAGASFEIKGLPAKKCDDQHYITIRTDTPDSKLPPEGTRISPAWAGVASLPGRPAFAQPPGGPAKLLATLVVRTASAPHLGDHYRFIGLEWTSEPGARVGALVTTEGADHAIFDRNWFHPAEGAEMSKGIGMYYGTRFIAVINSYLSGFYCVSRTGSCTDAWAVGGGFGQLPMSTLKIYNNFIESSGENIMFGGAGSAVNPTDIEIRRNHLFKPLLWKPGEPGYTPLGSGSGNPPIIKNHFELKSGIRVLFEANLLENSWGGYSQQGYSILLTAKNQNDRCPKCAVMDVTVRYNRIRNVAGVFVAANGFNNNGGAPADGGRYSVHDLIVDSVHDQDWKGQGTFGFLNANAVLLHDVAFDHVTAFVTGPLFFVGNRRAEKIPNFSVTNSLFMAGQRIPEFYSAGGGRENCAENRMGPQAVLEACFVNYKFEKNLIIGRKVGWPPGTIAVSSSKAAGVRDLQNGVSKDPRLCHANTSGCSQASPGASAATDGKDIGADVDAVEAAIAGVE